MKKLFTILITISVLIFTSCTSTDKTDNSTTNADTSGYMEQPKDQTQMNDTMPMIMPDTAHLHPDTIPH